MHFLGQYKNTHLKTDPANSAQFPFQKEKSLDIYFYCFALSVFYGVNWVILALKDKTYTISSEIKKNLSEQ